MTLLSASLYLLCIAFLGGSALYVWSKSPFAPLNSSYALLAFAILAWVGTLFLYESQTTEPGLLFIGRANFAAAALMAPAALVFVRALAQSWRHRYTWIFATESIVLALVSLFTGTVDKVETVAGTQHITTYGWLFPIYALHIVVYLAAAIVVAFQRHVALRKEVQTQLRLVGWGLLITSLVAIATNVVIPYATGSFRYVNFGTLTTIIFLGAVTYAAAIHHMFDIRLLIRRTLVYGVVISLTVELYQLAVDALTKLLPLGDSASQHVAAAGIALTINAFTHEPLKKLLEQMADKLSMRGKHRSKRRHAATPRV